jgi:NAD(P)-dependent dehydrogenase (short-subunit alcohol dehydrogenase family)
MMDKKTALVTGANKGVGLEIARRLLDAGYAVWLGCRDASRGEDAVATLSDAGRDVQFLQIDVTDDVSVEAAAATLAKHIDRLDALVNNAGIAADFRKSPSEETAEDMKAVYEVNVFGPVRVTRALLPLLKASAAPRIVMMSSGLASLANALDPASEFYGVNILSYNSSKTALNAVTVRYAKELEPLGFKVNAADPGYTATDLNGHTGYRTVGQAAEIAVRLAMLDPEGPTAGFFDENGSLPW